jgi:transcriptional regulator with XRE-family HTH domain
LDSFGEAVRQRRLLLGLSLRSLARAAHLDPGHLSRIEGGTRPPTAEVAASLDKALEADGALAALAEPRPADPTALESQRLARLLCTTPADAVDALAADADQLAIAYLAEPAAVMHEQASALRRAALTTLRRTPRPATLADLTVVVGRASGILAYAALDTGHAEAAHAHAEAALRAAEAVGHPDLRAWARGTQSLIARFDGDYRTALAFAEDGLDQPGDGTGKVRLLCGLAQCHANMADAPATHRALDLATDAQEHAGSDDVGIFGFTPAKQAYYSGSSLIWLPSPADAARARSQAQLAIDLWRRGEAQERSLNDEALAHLYAATASAQLNDLQAAVAYLEPILDLPPDRRISWIRKRMARVVELLKAKPYHYDRLAAETVERIREYR